MATTLTDEEIARWQEEDIILSQIQKQYFEVEWPRVKKALIEFQNEFSKEERQEMRRSYLLFQVEQAKKNPDPKIVAKLRREIDIFSGKLQGVTPEQVETARQSPLGKLMKHRNYMATCPFHQDDKPSMDIRNNFFYCYGCGAKGDVIDFVRRTQNKTFREAVLTLQ